METSHDHPNMSSFQVPFIIYHAIRMRGASPPPQKNRWDNTRGRSFPPQTSQGHPIQNEMFERVLEPPIPPHQQCPIQTHPFGILYKLLQLLGLHQEPSTKLNHREAYGSVYNHKEGNLKNHEGEKEVEDHHETLLPCTFQWGK